MGFDFFRIDFTVTRDGTILVFELNPAVHHSFDHVKNFPYLVEPCRTVAAAFNRIIAAKIE